MTAEPSRRASAAIDFDVGRMGVQGEGWTPMLAASRAVDAAGQRLLSAMALRVLCVLTGWWVAQYEYGCEPLRGHHQEECAHSQNRVDYTLASLARDVSGHSGGSQTRLITAALDELANATSEYHVTTDDGTLREVSHVLSLRSWEPKGNGGRIRTGYVVWDPFHFERLLAGSFQLVPPSIITELNREADVRLWLAVLNHPATASLDRAGRFDELAVTGKEPTIPAHSLGLGRQRADKLRQALERAAERGNDIQDHVEVEVLPRAKEGLKLRVTKKGTQPQPRQSRTSGTAPEDAEHGTRGHSPRQSRTAGEHKSGRVDQYQDLLLKTPFSDSGGGRPDVDALLRHGWKRVTPEQIRRLDEVALDRGGHEWAAEVIRRTPRGTDPLGRVFDTANREYIQERQHRKEMQAAVEQTLLQQDGDIPGGPS